MIFFLLIFQLPSVIGQHSFSWEGMWREVTELSKNASFAVREQAGHSLKSSLKVITWNSSSRVTGAGFFHTTFIFTIMCLGCLQSATNQLRHFALKGRSLTLCQRKKKKIKLSLPYPLHAMLCRCSSYLQKTTNTQLCNSLRIRLNQSFACIFFSTQL